MFGKVQRMADNYWQRKINFECTLNITPRENTEIYFVADGCWIKHLFDGPDHARKQQH